MIDANHPLDILSGGQVAGQSRPIDHRGLRAGPQHFEHAFEVKERFD